MFGMDFFMKYPLLLSLRYTIITKAIIKVIKVAQTIQIIIIVVRLISVEVLLSVTPPDAPSMTLLVSASVTVSLNVVIDVEESHSGSLKEAINTEQEDITFKICALIFIEGPLDTHCCNICTNSSAATSEVPWSCALYVTSSGELAKHWNPPFVIAVFISILHWHRCINSDVRWAMMSWDFSEGLSFCST